MWNPAVVIASSVLILGHAAAQEVTEKSVEAKLIALREAKLKSPFLQKAAWTTDFDVAKAAATKRGLPILVYFTCSYASSPPCLEVENKLFSAEQFGTLAGKAILFCHITSKVKADEHQDLLVRVGGDSFPHMIVTDAEGKRIAGVDRISSIKDVVSVLDGEVSAFLALRAQAAKGDKKAKAAYFLRRLRLGHLGPKEIEEELRTADYLTIEQQGAIRRSLASLEVMEILASVDDKKPESLRSAAERMIVMMNAGRVPSGNLAFPFWNLLLGHADQTEDPDLFSHALRHIKELPAAKANEKWLNRMVIRGRLLEHMKGRKKGGK